MYRVLLTGAIRKNNHGQSDPYMACPKTLTSLLEGFSFLSEGKSDVVSLPIIELGSSVLLTKHSYQLSYKEDRVCIGDGWGLRALNGGV